VVLASWAACQLFAGRAAFLLVGAMIATAMSANVFFWIIPGQRTVIAQMKAGQPVDPVHGQRAKQRSVHNTYFTLPVLVAMLSNHYGWLYQGPHNWAVLVLLMLAGALIRHSFVARHKALCWAGAVPWEYAIVGTCCWWAWPCGWRRRRSPAAQAPPPAGDSFARCRRWWTSAACCATTPRCSRRTWHCTRPELLQQHAQAVYQQAWC
jgi:uncharacterized membrane protein